MIKYFLILIFVISASSITLATPLTQEQRNVLAHIVVNPDTWQAHNEATAKDIAEAKARLNAKIEKWQPIYEAEKVQLGVRYKDRAAREVEAFVPFISVTNRELLDRAMTRSVFSALIKTLAKQFNLSEANLRAAILAEMEP